jgi:serralysin
MFVNGVGQGAPGANRIFLTVWDGGGVDTYNFSNYTSSLQVDLRPGYWTTTSAAQIADLHYNGTRPATGNIANALLYQDDVRSLIEHAIGGSGNDTIIGNDANNTLYGLNGADSLYGGEGNDVLLGGAGGDRLDGGNGTDTAYYSHAAAGVLADLILTGANTGEAAFDTYFSIENLVGTAHADRLNGDYGDNFLAGLGGNDVLAGRGGDDYLMGGLGADWLDGGPGSDTAFYANASSALVIDLLYASLNSGEAAGDRYVSIENATGSNHNDSIRGDNAANILEGLGGNDFLHGRGGNDYLYGGAGHDQLIGSSGADVLEGGAGNDLFIFRLTSDSLPFFRDTIRDFTPGQDLIDLRSIDANLGQAGDQIFAYIGGGLFSGIAGELNYRNSVLAADVNGDGLADFEVNMFNSPSLSVTDFLL